MTQSNPMPDPSPENPEEQKPSEPEKPGAEPAKPAPAPRKRRRRWPWVIVSIFLLLIVLVLIAPTLLSMGWARALVLSQVNGRVNGNVEIKDWSLGWLTPVRVNGIIVNDQSNRQILQLPQLTTGLTLLDIVRGKYSLGQIKVEGLDVLVSREADGSINWQHVAKTSGSATPSPAAGKGAEPTKLPDVSGEVILSNCSLTYEDRTGGSQPVYLRSIQADVKIPSINAPISDSFSADAVVGTNPPGKLSASGTIQAVANNQVSIDTADIDQTVKLTGLELASISGLLGSAIPVNLAGRTDGQVVLHLAKGADGTLQTNLEGRRLFASGGNSNFTSDSLSLRIPNATIHLPGGAQKAAENMKVDLGDGVTLAVANVNLTQGQGAAVRSIIKGDKLSFDARGSYSADASGRGAHFTRLDVSDAQKMFSIQKSPDADIELTLPAAGNPTAKGGIVIAADLKRINDVLEGMSAKVVAKDANQMELQSGKLAGQLTFAQAAADQISMTGAMNVTEISVGNASSSPINGEKIQVTFKALANHNLSEVEPTLDVTGDLVSAHMTDTTVSLAPDASLFQKLKKVTLTAEVPSLAKLQALMRSLSPTKPAAVRLVRGPALAFAGKTPPKGSLPPAGAAQETPRMEITSGSATLTVNASPAGQALHILPKLTISNLGLKKGDTTYSLSSIELTSDSTFQPPQAVPTTGAVSAVASNPPVPAPGAFSPKTAIGLKGLTINGQRYPEQDFQVGADAAFRSDSRELALRSLTFKAGDTTAVAAVVKGIITDLGGAQRIDNVLTVDLDYDASQLLKLVVPLLSPDLQAKLKDAQAAGKYHKRFEVRGAYPSGVEFGKAVQQLAASADLQLDSFDGAGLSLRNVDLPIMLVSGFVRIIYADKPTGQNLPPAMVLNDGRFNIGGSQVDLRGATPTLSILDNLAVLDNVSLNPIFATWALGTMLDNPLFVEVKQASGFLSLRVLNCRDLPLNSSVTSASATGTASLDLSIRELQITGGLLQNLSDVAHLNSTSLRGDVPSWRINVSRGMLDQDLTMTLLQGQRPLRVYGKVRLADKQLMPLTIELPWKLFGIKGVPKEVAGFMPDGIVIPMTGTLDKPQLAFDFNKAFGDAVQKSILPGTLGRPGDQQNTTQPAEQPDPIKQLQDLLNRNKNKKKQ
jgi:hypothetical protein